MGNNCCSGGAGGQEFIVPVSGVSMPRRTTFKLGWRRDLPDVRDRVLAIAPEGKKDLPTAKDLRPKEDFLIYNQGGLGSCTANAIGACYHFALEQQKPDNKFVPSRLFVYYNERAMEGTTEQDSGAMIRDGIKSVNQIGVCSESEDMWPYVESQFTVKPSAKCYTQAAKHRAQEYARVPQTLDDMKACISGGFPFVFGFVVYSSFMTASVASSGMMSMPNVYDQQQGGHAVMAVGYDDARKVFIIRNSWGEGWGDKGYFYMPYDYITNPSLVMDLWTISFVTTRSLGSVFSTTTLTTASA